MWGFIVDAVLKLLRIFWLDRALSKPKVTVESYSGSPAALNSRVGASLRDKLRDRRVFESSVDPADRQRT